MSFCPIFPHDEVVACANVKILWSRSTNGSVSVTRVDGYQKEIVKAALRHRLPAPGWHQPNGEARCHDDRAATARAGRRPKDNDEAPFSTALQPKTVWSQLRYYIYFGTHMLGKVLKSKPTNSTKVFQYKH